MGVPDPNARGDAGLNTRLARTEKDLAQLRRLIEARAKPAAAVAAAAAGGGVTGITRVSCWSLSATPAGAKTFIAPTGPELEELAGDGPNLTVTGDTITVDDAGFYIAKMDAWISFDTGDGATYVRFALDHEGSSYHFPQLLVPIVANMVSSGPDAVTSWLSGPFAIPAGGFISYDGSYNDGGSHPSVNYWSLDVSRIG